MEFTAKMSVKEVNNETINRVIDYARLKIYTETGAVVSFDLCKEKSEINQTFENNKYVISVTTNL